MNLFKRKNPSTLVKSLAKNFQVIKNVFSHWQKGWWDIMILGFFKNTCAIIIILKEKIGVFFFFFLMFQNEF